MPHTSTIIRGGDRRVEKRYDGINQVDSTIATDRGKHEVASVENANRVSAFDLVWCLEDCMKDPAQDNVSELPHRSCLNWRVLSRISAVHLDQFIHITSPRKMRRSCKIQVVSIKWRV